MEQAEQMAENIEESLQEDHGEYNSDISDIFDKLEGIEKYEGEYLEEYSWNKNTKKILNKLKMI